MRNVLAQVPKSAQPMVAAFVRTIYGQPDKASVHAQLAVVTAELAGRILKAAQLLNREIGRRTDVAGIFPNAAAVIRLAGAFLQEQHDEWIAATVLQPKVDEQAVPFRRRNTAIGGAVDT